MTSRLGAILRGIVVFVVLFVALLLLGGGGVGEIELVLFAVIAALAGGYVVRRGWARKEGRAPRFTDTR